MNQKGAAMEYNTLYDESPYTAKETRRHREIINPIRAIFLICVTILACVFAIIFYSYQQDQYVINSNGAFISIFDKKSKTLNICDKGNCNLITPTFESHPFIKQEVDTHAFATPHMPAQQMSGQPSPRILGSFTPPQMPNNPQMFGQPQMGRNNPQMMQQGMQARSNPQMMTQMMPSPQMLPQRNNPQVMAQMPSPQFMGQNPQMMQHLNNPQIMNPQMIRGVPQAAQAQMTGGVPQANSSTTTEDAGTTDDTTADNTADDTSSTDDANATDDTTADNTTEDTTSADDANTTGDSAADDTNSDASSSDTEEAAPV